MLTSRYAGASSASWSAAPVGAAMMLSVMALIMTSIMTLIMTWTPAQAGGTGGSGISDTNCVGTWTNFNCVTQWGPAVDPYVRLVPEALGEADKARLMARERKWLARCRPVISRDSYGVARYRYSAPGCEFGVGED